MYTLKRHVFLIGFMGSGKSTRGKRMAKMLGVEFIDLDDIFVEENGMSIQAFFKEYGEEEFRKKEKEILQKQHLVTPSVIATGGGTPCYADNMKWMIDNGITIYLKLPNKLLAQRLFDSKHHKRPLVDGKPLEEILRIVDEKMNTRSAYYEQAHFHTNSLEHNEDSLIDYLFAADVIKE